MATTYAVVTPITKVKDGWRFRVKPPTWNEHEPWIVHTYATKDLGELGRHGWISYYKGRHVSVRSKLSCVAAQS